MKKIGILIISLLIISCTTTTVPKKSSLSKAEIIKISIEEVKNKYGILINEKDNNMHYSNTSRVFTNLLIIFLYFFYIFNY